MILAGMLVLRGGCRERFIIKFEDMGHAALDLAAFLS